MRLSEWRAGARSREALGTRVLGALEPVLGTLGAEKDPHVWVSWGEDPAFRYALFALTPGGLGVVNVRPGPPGGEPRVSAKLVRWPRVQIGEIDVETQASHRLVTVQLEGQVLRGVDGEADRIVRFVQAVIASIDGRPLPSLDEPRRRRGRSTPTARGGTAKASPAKAAPAKEGPTKAAGARKTPAGSSARGAARG